MRSGFTKRFLLLLSLLSLTVIFTSSASAAPYIYDQFPTGSFISSGLPFSSYALVNIESLAAFTPPATDPQHQCLNDTPGNPTAGTYTLWFAFSVSAGQVSISTIGSNYNTIVTLYRYAPQVGGLVPLGCNDDVIAVSTATLNVSVPTGSYIVQISRVNTTPASGLNLTLDVDYLSDTPAPSNDTVSAANTATITTANGKAFKTKRVQAATVDTEDSSIWTLNSCFMYNTVWHSFTPAYDGYYNFNTSGSILYRDDNRRYTDTVLTVMNTGDNTFPVPCADGTNYATASNVQLTAGMPYVIGVGTFNDLNLMPPSFYKLKVSAYEIAPFSEGGIFFNGDFEIGDSTGWKTKNFGVSDGVILGGLSGSYAINITAQNGVKKKLSTSTVFPASGGFIPQPESNVDASYVYVTSGVVNGTVSLKIEYSNRAPTVVVRPLISDSVTAITTDLSAEILDKTVTKITLTVKVNSGSGVLTFDAAALRYFGGQTRTAGVLPMPSAR